MVKKELIKKDFLRIDKSESVSKLIDKMNEYDISSLVIVKDKKPIGIITLRDLLKLFMKDRLTF